jgi:adenylate cyclase
MLLPQGEGSVVTDVFISYSRSDRKRVRLIALGLAAEGFSVWWDPEIKPGAKWNDAIRKSLDNAAAVITCWSPDSVKSSWVVAETTHASNKNCLVPCTVRSCHPPIPFNMIQSADLWHWKGYAVDPDWMLLLRQVRRLV